MGSAFACFNEDSVCSDAWIAFLRLPILESLFKRLLHVLTSTVLPNLRNPILLSDFLTHAVGRGGLVGILALHGLFVLMTQHGMEYRRFYERLYGLLTPQVRLPQYA
jgi:U3 small nucleolar RNA-associated protein 19